MLKNKINIIDTNNINFYNILNVIIKKNIKKNLKINNYIKNILYNINKYKEKALLYYLKKFEKYEEKNIKSIIVNKEKLEKSYNKLDKETKYILEFSKNRIEKFHEEQKKNINANWKSKEESGIILGQKKESIERVGFYIPNGKASYPSSVFMNIIPAIVAKVSSLTICCPKRKNNDLIWGAFYMCGIKEIFAIGGAQAVISMALGNKVIKKVDKICGPGNHFVAFAKKLIYGQAGIDSIAGPSEITIIADKNSDPEKIVLSMLSQSEHDMLSQSILICDDILNINKVAELLKKYIPFLYRKNIIYNSIINNILIIKTKNLNESFNLINFIAPEHLIIYLNNGIEFFKNIKNSGTVFIEKYTNEGFGDYTSGLNHVLPTNRTSKFSSPLGIYDFYKNINFLKINEKGFLKLNRTTMKFSKKEKLYSHFESLKFNK